MIYAPVVIPTLNRFEHFKRCIESLGRCNWADQTDVYIALDYPPSKQYEAGYKKINEYLSSSFFHFKSIIIIRRDRNYGPGENSKDVIRNYIWPKYDRMIFTEDDNCFSKTFLQFIDIGLEKCELRDDILAIGGYALPANWKDDGSELVLLNSNANAWGYGMLRKSYYELANIDIHEYYHSLLSSKERTKRILSGSKNDCGGLAWFVMTGNYGINDTFKSIYIRDKGMYCLFPKTSLVFNTGSDGSGLSSGKRDTYGFTSIQIDERDMIDTTIFERIPPYYEEETMKAINSFFSIPAWKMIWVRFVFFAHRFWDKHTRLGKSLRNAYLKLNPRL